MSDQAAQIGGGRQQIKIGLASNRRHNSSARAVAVSQKAEVTDTLEAPWQGMQREVSNKFPAESVVAWGRCGWR